MQPSPRIPDPRSAHRAARCGVAVFLVIGIAAATTLAAPLAAASVYKCRGDGGMPIYQETACPPGRELRNFDTDPPALSIVPGTESASLPAAEAPLRRAAERAPAENPRRARAARGSRGDPSERRHLHAGMSDGEVLAKLGRPDITAGAGRKGNARWTYLPAPGDDDTITTLYMRAGTVVDIERKVVKR